MHRVLSLVVASRLSFAKFKEIDSKRKFLLTLPKFQDAKFAGTANSGDCTLILTQGDSAEAFAMRGLSVVGHDNYGVFHLTNKLLDVREDMLENAEYQNLMKILGLQCGSFDLKHLRYGHLMIITGQDHEGSLLKGLLINFLHLYWPSLLKVSNFLRVFRRPIYLASNKSTSTLEVFYTIASYDAWTKEIGDNATNYKITYFKGLASIPLEDGKLFFSDLDNHINDFFWVDADDDAAIDLAFGKNMIKERKEWLQTSQPDVYFDPKEKRIRYRDFICLDFRQYLVADLQRSIPSLVDGLKPDQRSILFCALKKPNIQDFDVDQFSEYASVYYNGEESLVGTIVGMAQNYVGSNNINFLQPKGQFGTRYMGGKDHRSGRYLSVELSPITRYLFHEDDESHKYLDGGRFIEHACFIPVIPVVLVNGSEGSGTGFSSFIPNYNPHDIILNLERRLNGEAMVTMDPWYKGFNGKIQPSGDTQYTTTGKYEVIEDENALLITELPIRKWVRDFKKFLDAALQDGKDKTSFIKDYNFYIDDDETMRFKIFMTKNQMRTAEQEGFLKKFELTTTLSTADMHLFDANGLVKKYDKPEQILEEFFDFRLNIYRKRRTSLLQELREAILLLEHEVEHMKQVLEEEKNCVSGRKTDELCNELQRSGNEPLSPSSAGAAGEDTRTESSLTYEKKQELLNTKVKEFNTLCDGCAELLWLRDLAALKQQLKEQDGVEVQEKVMKKMVISEGDSDCIEEEHKDGARKQKMVISEGESGMVVFFEPFSVRMR